MAASLAPILRRHPGAGPAVERSVLKPKLLDVLVCPTDQTRLGVSSGSSSGEIVEEGALTCEDGHEFPIRAGVPRMVPGDSGEVDQSATFDSFSAKWSKVSTDELKQRFDQQHEWYTQRFGWESEDALTEFLASKHLVLEAGTGLGGDAARFARLSDAEVVAIDLSEAITTAHAEFGEQPNVHYVQADLLRPPFRQEQFDFVSADQVIHHTPDARRAFDTLAGLLRPGGVFATYLYKVKAPIRELADDWIRERTTKMSVEDCMEFSAGITELGRELSRTGASVNLERGVPLLGIEPGEHDVQRLIYWTFLKAFWNDDFSDNLNVLVNFDWYHPPYASRHTPEEVREWCAETGLDIDHFDVGDAGISVRASRAGAR